MAFKIPFTTKTLATAPDTPIAPIKTTATAEGPATERAPAIAIAKKIAMTRRKPPKISKATTTAGLTEGTITTANAKRTVDKKPEAKDKETVLSSASLTSLDRFLYPAVALATAYR